tara:strand:- start:173 stop:382 length:210 start_codon:yes stop_codon:yes gene_type:complete
MNIKNIASRILRKLTHWRLISKYDINDWMNMSNEDRNLMDKLYKRDNKNKKNILLKKIRNEYRKIKIKQ